MNGDAAILTLLAMGLPFVAAAFAPYVTRWMGHRGAWVLALAPAAVFVHFLGYREGRFRQRRGDRRIPVDPRLSTSPFPG